MTSYFEEIDHRSPKETRAYARECICVYVCVFIRSSFKIENGKTIEGGRRIATEIDKREIGKTEISRIFKIWIVRAQLL